jgi:acetyl esterase/lipase
MNNPMNILYLMSLIVSLASCQGKALQPDTSHLEKTLTNISYGKDSLQKMDVYLPANRSKATKVLVLIHGGGWASGDKSEFANALPSLREQLPTYAVVNLNYRLATQVTNHFPTQEQDIQTAVKFILDKSEEYNTSKDLVLLGTSAGAHLALLQAYKHANMVKPKAVISFFGPTDMADMYNRQSNSYYQFALGLLVGGTPTSKPDVYKQSSPINFVSPQSAPTMILHGAKDGLVPVAQSKSLKEKLDKAGVPAELVIYPQEGHGWWGATQQDSFKKIAAFLNKFVGK